MKLSVFSLLVMVFALRLPAQKKESFDHTTFRHIEVKFGPDKSKPIVSLSFSGLEVHDRRTDTSLFGFFKIAQFDKSTEGVLKSEQPASTLVRSFLEKQIRFDPQSGTKLIVIIRKLWVSKEIENNMLKDNNPKMQKAFLPGVIACIEFYANQNDDFIPLYRFDSTILDHNRRLEFTHDDLLKKILNESILAISRTNFVQKIQQGSRYTWLQVDSFSRQSGLLKILTASTYKKGVYSSYNEFVNNQPSIENYEIRKTDLSQALYVRDENGIEYPIRKIWGFSDGEHIFIKSVDLFFKLEKFNNNFYCWATKNISTAMKLSVGDIILSVATGVVTGITPVGTGRKTKAVVFLKLYQLDLETGKLY